MKYIVMAALLMAGTASFAQQPVKQHVAKPRGEAPMAKKLTPAEKAAKLKTDLGLNANQEAKVTELYVKQEADIAEIKEKRKVATSKEDKAAFAQNLKANREQFNANMKEILTEEQYAKFSGPKAHRLAEGLKEGAAQGKAVEKPATLSPGN